MVAKKPSERIDFFDHEGAPGCGVWWPAAWHGQDRAGGKHMRAAWCGGPARRCQFAWTSVP